MKIEVLGSGTSQGVPVIGCKCRVCQSKDPKDHRLRCALWISTSKASIVIDTGPDFRYQMLRAKVPRLDAIIITHEHNDHIIGIDDVRPFNFSQNLNMPIYATAEVQSQLRKRFDYVFADKPYPGVPRLHLKSITNTDRFEIADLEVIPIQVYHGSMPVLGFRIGDFTYITDANRIEESEREKIRGSKYLIINALHHKKHYSHFNLEEALEIIKDLAPKQAFLTHVSHNMGLAREINETLPDNVQLAFDGLQLELP